MHIFGKLVHLFAWKLVSRTSNKFLEIWGLYGNQGFTLYNQPAPKYHTKGCSRSSVDSPGARTLVFEAVEPFSSHEFRASIARTPFCAILWRSPIQRKCFGAINFVKITKESLYKANSLACFVAKRDTPVAATSQRKSSGGIIFVITTKIITKENVPRNYFVIISARMVE